MFTLTLRKEKLWDKDASLCDENQIEMIRLRPGTFASRTHLAFMWVPSIMKRQQERQEREREREREGERERKNH